MDKKFDIEDKDKSEFNAGIATLQRLHEIKRGLNYASINRDYNLKFRYLEAYYMELISIMNTKDEAVLKPQYEEALKCFHSFNNAVAKGNRTISKNIIEGFMEWEMILRNMDQKYDLNIPKKSDARYAFGGGR